MVSVRSVFLLLALLLPGFRIMAAEEPRLTEFLPDAGTVRVEGDRLDIFDREGRRQGYGVRRGDGSWDLYRKNGSRLGTIQKDIGGQPDRVVVPKRGK